MKRALTVALAAGAIGFLAWLWFFRATPQQNAFQARALATRALADYLAQHQPSHRVLVIANPFTQRPETPAAILNMEQAGIRGVQQAWPQGDAAVTVAYPALRPEAETDPRALLTGIETTTPLSFLVTTDAFDTLAAQHPDCDSIVSLIGLPADLRAAACWTRAGPPRFALLLPDLRLIGNRAAIRAAFLQGKLAAAVLPRPNAPGADEPITDNWRPEFERRFILVTAENLDQLMQAYPGGFPPG